MLLIKKYIILAVIAFTSLLPFYRQTTSDFAMIEQGADYLGEKWLNDTWDIFSDAAKKVKEQLFKEDEPVPLTTSEKMWHFISYGFGYGLNSIGSTEKLIKDYSYNIYEPNAIIGTSILVIIFIQIIFTLFKSMRKYIPILSITNILLAILLFGFVLDIQTADMVITGWALFVISHICIVVYLSLEKK